jgi:hypothetical protein
MNNEQINENEINEENEINLENEFFRVIFGGREYIFIDTPGFFDNGGPEVDISNFFQTRRRIFTHALTKKRIFEK